ncbi:MAG: thioesterase family protein [Cyanobacteria bacterium J06639_1]
MTKNMGCLAIAVCLKFAVVKQPLGDPETPYTREVQHVTSMSTAPWFEFNVRAQPHHTDFGGIVWHGHYIAWMEAARVDVLRQIGMPFETFVAADINLVVVDLNLRYRRPVSMGEEIVVLERPLVPQSVRLPWEYEIRSRDREILHVSATLTLAPVDGSGKLYRRHPQMLADAYDRIQQGNGM